MSWFFATPKIKRIYNYVRDLHSPEDKYHNFIIQHRIHSITKVVDLRNLCPPVYNQACEGSCTANAIAANIEIDEIKQNNENIFVPSRNFIYYNERMIENTVTTDSGARISDGIKTLNTYGICDEKLWPYDTTKFAIKPPEDCYIAAKTLCGSFESKKLFHNIDQLKQCLIDGNCFVFGFSVYESFESENVEKTGIVPMPKPGEKLYGGHAVVACGFDDNQKVFIIRNSWGENWGDKGYFYLSYDFIKNREYCSDFQTITRVFSDYQDKVESVTEKLIEIVENNI